MDTYEARLEAALTLQIKVELLERGMDQKDLADAVGIERVTLNRYFKGHRSMPMPTLYRVAQVLGLEAHELVRRAEARLDEAKQ